MPSKVITSHNGKTAIINVVDRLTTNKTNQKLPIKGKISQPATVKTLKKTSKDRGGTCRSARPDKVGDSKTLNRVGIAITRPMASASKCCADNHSGKNG